MPAFVVLRRKAHSDHDEVVGELWREMNAINYARDIFKSQVLDRVRVVRVSERDNCDVVYLQERNCKHPQLQIEMEFLEGVLHHLVKCIDCGEVVKREVKHAESNV